MTLRSGMAWEEKAFMVRNLKTRISNCTSALVDDGFITHVHT